MIRAGIPGLPCWRLRFRTGLDDGDYADKFWLIQSGHVALDVLVPGEGPAVIGQVGIGGLVGWSWLLPPYQRTSGAVCVTEVRAFGAIGDQRRLVPGRSALGTA